MKPYDQNIVTFEAMFAGYVDALERFTRAQQRHDHIATYAAVFETLNWAVALDDRTAAHFVPDGKHIGYDWRDRIPNAEVMGGVRYARNSVHHQWSDAMRLDPDRDPRVYPGVYQKWVWRAADELPPPDKKPNAQGERFYRDQMQGRPVEGCLNVLGGVFLTLQQLLEPHTIRNVLNPREQYPYPEDEIGILPDGSWP
jgi:hypothetical protein